MQFSSSLEAALAYVERFGWSIFPVGLNKIPLTSHGRSDATTDPTVIREWSRRWPRALIAVATGEQSGIVAVDVDIKKPIDGRDSLEALGVITHPVTPTSHSPSGGFHMLFRHPGHFVKTVAGRAAMIDGMMRKFSTTAEGAGTTEPLLARASFIKAFRNNEGVLKELLAPPQMDAFRAVTADLERADRVLTNTRNKNNPSGTAADVRRIIGKPAESRIHAGDLALWELMLEAGREAFGEGDVLHAGTKLGAGLAAIKAVGAVKTARAAGMAKVQDMVREAILHPEYAKYLFSRAPDKQGAMANAFTSTLRRNLVNWPIASDAAQRRQD